MNFNGEIYHNADQIISGSVIIEGDLRVNGRVFLADGDSSNPSLTFASNPTRGFWYESAWDALHLEGAASTEFFIEPLTQFNGVAIFTEDVVMSSGLELAGGITADELLVNGNIATNSMYTFGPEDTLGIVRDAPGHLAVLVGNDNKFDVSSTVTHAKTNLLVDDALVVSGTGAMTATAGESLFKEIRINPGGRLRLNDGYIETTGTVSAGASTFAGVTSTAAITAGTNSLTAGSTSLSGSLTAGTNSLTAGSLVSGVGTNPFVMSMTAGSTSTGMPSCQWLNTAPTAGNLYGLGITKTGAGAIMMGVNKDSATGDVPASACYISNGGVGVPISIGLGNSNLPNQSNILINTNGSVNFGRQPYAMWTAASTQTISSSTTTTAVTIWSTTPTTSRGNLGTIPTISGGTVTVPVAGNYQINVTTPWTTGGGTTGSRWLHVLKGGDAQRYGAISVPVASWDPQPISTGAKVAFTAGQTFTVHVAQDSGSNRDLGGSDALLVIEKVS